MPSFDYIYIILILRESHQFGSISTIIFCNQAKPDHNRKVPPASSCEAVVREDIVFQFDERTRRISKMGLLAVADFNDHSPVIRYPIKTRSSS